MNILRTQKTTNRIKLQEQGWFKPFLIGNLPPSFAFKYNESDDNKGVTKWFNYKGLTYIQE